MVVVGMDEVGRGSWAGPVVVGAVILQSPIPGLRDSKLLSVKSREKLAQQIREQAWSWGLGQASAREIDQFGLTAALRLAYQRALEAIPEAYDEVIIDGHFNFLPDNSAVRTIIKADQTVPAVSAASIIAKVARDELMTNFAADFPNYGFDQHVGYGTAQHAATLKEFGICDIHRRSFKPIHQIIEVQA